MKSGKLVLVIGPSGVGKSAVLRELRTRHPELHFPRSATTRARREGEGDDLYVFLSDAEFDAALKREEFLEWAQVHGGARYGTLIREILPAMEQGDIVVREVDVQGFMSIRKDTRFASGGLTLQSIFILPESKEQLMDRIGKRAPMVPEELARRMASVEKELAVAELCDLRVVNAEGKLEETINQIEKFLGIQSM